MRQDLRALVRLTFPHRESGNHTALLQSLDPTLHGGALQPTQVSLAMWHNCRMALDVARDCRDLLGGAGISAGHVPIRHMLNIESAITYEGTESIHQLTAGRELTGLSAF